MKESAFAATFADWKLIRTRKVVQIVMELPLEAADQAYQVLGGMPDPGKSIWCAVARLKPEMEVSAYPKEQPEHLSSPGQHKVTPDSEAEAAPGRARTKWRDKPLASQAAIRCSDPAYQRFLGWHMQRNGLSGIVPKNYEDATKLLKGLLRIVSRAELVPGTDAGVRWDCLETEYAIWLRSPEMAA